MWRSGSSKSSGSRSPSRRSAASCGIWAFASSRRDRAIMRKTRKPRRLLKKLSRSRGGDGRKRGVWQADRDLVSRRSSDRAEKQGHPPMGETRDTAFGAARPEDEFSLYFRRHLPGRRKRRRACPPLLQQRGHGPASRRNLACGRTKRACARSSRSGRVACLGEASRPGQHHALAVAAEIARAQSGREHLAVHARQLALEPRLRILRRHSRPLLLRLEQAHRHALENHLHRNKRVGLSVVISETWYNTLEQTDPTLEGQMQLKRLFMGFVLGISASLLASTS